MESKWDLSSHNNNLNRMIIVIKVICTDKTQRKTLKTISKHWKGQNLRKIWGLSFKIKL